ncbi:MAG: hypothetical protein HQM12_01920 [SAR324 cluster bacterium]|nr:hypothetical protein [SAR324 cluster bacterium]
MLEHIPSSPPISWVKLPSSRFEPACSSVGYILHRVVLLLFLGGMTTAIVSANNNLTSSMVYQFDGGQLSKSTFFLLSQTEFEKIPDPVKIVDTLEFREAQGLLATRHGLKTDPRYSWFLLRKRRGRLANEAHLAWKRHTGGNQSFSYEAIWKAFAVQVDLTSVSASIEKLVNRDPHLPRLTTDPGQVNVGHWAEGDITLAMLKLEMLEEDWTRMLVFSEPVRQQALLEALKYWTHTMLSKKVVADFGAVKEELERQDHNRVAELFLLSRYRQGGKGIYPVDPLHVKFTRTQLFDHYMATRSRFRQILQLNARYTVVKDWDIATEFIEKLEEGQDFKKLAESSAVNEKFIQTADIHVLPPIPAKSTSSNAKPTIEDMVWEIARSGDKEISVHPLDNGYLIAQVIAMREIDAVQQFQDVQSIISLDLEKQLLTKQYPRDLQQIRRTMHFEHIPPAELSR